MLNSRQIKIVIISTLIFIIMGLFPPWTYTHDNRSMHIENPAGYGFIIEPPESKGDSYRDGIKLDVSRLTIQWLMLIVLSGSALFLTKKRDTKKTHWDE